MSKSAILNIRIDPALKQETEKLLRQLGLTPSQAITLFYTQINLQHELPFQTDLPNEESLQAIDDLVNHRNTWTCKNVDALRKDLEI
jgi:DNA-damage-inducible protein J